MSTQEIELIKNQFVSRLSPKKYISLALLQRGQKQKIVILISILL